MKVAIVGAGIAGLACAARLKQDGIEPVLFDKGRRAGGRMSTLRLGDWAWDFGCQTISRGEGAFALQVDEWKEAGLLAPWPDGPPGALVGMPAMASLIEAQCRDLRVHFGSFVQRLEHRPSGWCLAGPEMEAGPFAGLVLAIPAEQAAPLLSLHDLDMAREASAGRSLPCWTVMAAFGRPLAAPHWLRDRGAIAWAARENSKPGRGAAECWVIQAGPEWSLAHLEEEREAVARQLMALFAEELGAAVPEPQFLKAHRWRFALPYAQNGNPLWNPRLRLGACGDWCTAGHVEGAWRAGLKLAGKVAAGVQEQPALIAQAGSTLPRPAACRRNAAVAAASTVRVSGTSTLPSTTTP